MQRKYPIDPVDLHVGQRLTLARNLRGKSQEELGRVTGVSFQQIQKYESAYNRISASRLYHTACYLGYRPEWFFVGLPLIEVNSHEVDIDNDILGSRETQKLISTYYRINDRKKREAVLGVLLAMID
jgi:transcriptional regulator with XRE-family HTH domain